MHLEHACMSITVKRLGITCNIAEDIAVRSFMSTEALVKNRNFKEVVSSSKNLHAPSIHECDYIPEVSKLLVKK